MLNFVFILSIIFEISITVFLILKLIEAQKTVEIWNKRLIYGGAIALELNKNLNNATKKINKVVSIFTNKKLYAIAHTLRVVISVVQTIVIIRSVDFSRGFFVNAKTVKNLLYTQIFKGIVKSLCKYL